MRTLRPALACILAATLLAACVRTQRGRNGADLALLDGDLATDSVGPTDAGVEQRPDIGPCLTPPCLDPSFANNGTLRLDNHLISIGWTAHAIAVQPDGKLVVTGVIQPAGTATGKDALVARFLPDGRPDLGFGGAGFVRLDVGDNDSGKSVSVLPDGRIIVAGSADSRAFAARLSVAGALDASFGVAGVFEATLSPAVFNGHTHAANGELVLGGHGFVANEGRNMLLVRLDAQGAPDPTFDNDGEATPDFTQADEFGNTPVVQPDGKILLSGSTWKGGGASHDCALLRVDATGTPDPGFGVNGRVSTDIDGKTNRCSALALLADGRIVAAGYVDSAPGQSDLALTRYGQDGSLDPSFGSAGKVVLDLGGSATIRALVPLKDGRVLAVGHRDGATSRDFALACIDASGALDPSFGQAGVATYDVGGKDELHYAQLDAQGRLLTIGGSTVAGHTTIVVMRLRPL
jgi:uncharacterized delta-60 repeat protein